MAIKSLKAVVNPIVLASQPDGASHTKQDQHARDNTQDTRHTHGNSPLKQETMQINSSQITASACGPAPQQPFHEANIAALLGTDVLEPDTEPVA